MTNPEIQTLIERGALFVLNHSGGKDSQAMMIKVREMVPADQIFVIHADLPGADWPGTWDHVVNTTEGYRREIVVAHDKGGKVKTFFDMVRSRQMWPSPKYRQCTSDLKRGPIEKAIRHFIKDNDLSGLIVNCMGLRAEESCMRAKAVEFKHNARNSKAGREWYDWLPIHDWTTEQVFATIAAAGEEPHWAYQKGMERLSCIFCIMASKKDLCTAANLQPEVYRQYVELELEIGHTFLMPKKGCEPRTLEEVTGIEVDLNMPVKAA